MASPLTIQNRAKRLDRLMGWVISFGGMLIIAAVLGILVFIAREALPLGRSARIQAWKPYAVPAAEGLILNETGRVGFAIHRETGIRAFRTDDGSEFATLTQGPALPWQLLATPSAEGEFAALGKDGRLTFGRLAWERPSGENDPTRWTPSVTWTEAWPAGPGLTALLDAHLTPGEGLVPTPTVRVAALRDGQLQWSQAKTGEAGALAWKAVSLPEGERASAARWGADGSLLYVGTRQGFIRLFQVDAEAVQIAELQLEEGVSTMGFALGRNSLIVGGEKGKLFAVQRLRQENGQILQPFHRFAPLDGPVLGIVPSLRDKRFLAWSSGRLVVDHLTTEKRLFDQALRGTLQAAYSPRGTLILAATSQGRAQAWQLDVPHPEISMKTLWGKVHYESYDKPEYVWQSSGSTDDFEPKLSLVPMVFGTLKGTLYAMLFALPLAVFGALYTSQFATPRLRNTIKPMVEIMAALPSVVLGFLAGLVLAPLFEARILHVFLLPLMSLLIAMVLFPLWVKLPTRFRNAWGSGREALWLVPVLLGGLALTLVTAPVFERIFLEGDFRAWLLESHGMTYDQRNSLVVGFAMGFAVIPIIFTISEDALTSVPRALTSASLACGASPWQTAWRVVLPTASPGIFSAIMVGFGRAIGETMIVLMATGNTPVLDWSPFNGMRTLAANIAVETPEAPVHGTLYRLLFLTALLLFALTFILNTVAEVVRQHLRKRYESF